MSSLVGAGATNPSERGAIASRRIPSIDIARGFAVLGMFGYHLTWDLAHFGFIDSSRPFSLAFRLYSHTVASAFLVLAGASLVLARRTPFNWTAWTKHIATICIAAAAVTIASFFFFPEGLIGFGILHSIAASLIVATPFLFLPASLAFLAAAVIAIAPMIVQSPAFNVPALIWTGLGTIEPSSNDYRPFFPWAAPTFVGLGLMAAARDRLIALLSRWRPGAKLWQVIAWGGRHSLIIYLLHQPLFFGALAGLAAIAPPGGPDGAFTRPCEAKCTASGAPLQTCQTTCACAAHEIRALNLWDRMIANALDDAEKTIVSRAAQQCLRNARS